MLWEWQTLVCGHDRNPVLDLARWRWSARPLLLVVGLARHCDRAHRARLLRRRGAGVAGRGAAWCAAGLLYAAALLIAPVLLRRDAGFGFAAILFLFAIVWLTDIAAYFAGRAIGGPKLMPRVSPNKTWSGAIGGTLPAVVGGVLVARQFAHRQPRSPSPCVALVLSVVSQAGDLFESAVKRQFNAKDASQLIPGHGGLMDRLDGFVAAAVAAR